MASSFNDDTETIIPFFPTFDYEYRHLVHVWWFERDFSQTLYGKNATKGSNACTLIALITASKICKRKINLQQNDSRLPYSMIMALAESIIEGNEIYCHLMDKGELEHVNLNIPEAMTACKDKISTHIYEWKSTLYIVNMGENIYNEIKLVIKKWNEMVNSYHDVRMSNYSDVNHLFIILIADNRSILLIYQQEYDIMTLIDSHQHSSRHGCVIVQVNMGELKNLCTWIRRMYQEIYQSNPNCFELSYLHEIKYKNKIK